MEVVGSLTIIFRFASVFSSRFSLFEERFVGLLPICDDEFSFASLCTLDKGEKLFGRRGLGTEIIFDGNSLFRPPTSEVLMEVGLILALRGCICS